MKLLRFGDMDLEKPGILDSTGVIRDLSGVIEDINSATLDPETLARVAEIDPASLPMAPQNARIGPCVAKVGNFVCIGLNYRDHADEAGMTHPTEPIIFMKTSSAVCGPDDDYQKPIGSTKLDWEVELGVVIGTLAKNVSEDDAMSHVAGYCTVNDGSERAFQIERLGQWTKGKSHDSFGPIGPWLVTVDEVADPHALTLTSVVNGKVQQNGSTENLIFSIPQLISYVSGFITLSPGDIIATGTPAGVGMGQKPQAVYLNDGDTLDVEVVGLGRQSHKIVQVT